MAHFDRNNPQTANLETVSSLGDKTAAVLDIVVEAQGRQNFGCDRSGYDFKGIQPNSSVNLNGMVSSSKLSRIH